MSTLEKAQALAADFAWSVYPVNRRKLPVWNKGSEFPNGSKDASSDEIVIERLWHKSPGALVAVRLDYSGLMAVDVDRHVGAADGVLSLTTLAGRAGDLPNTVSQISVSGNGVHYIFKAPGCEIKKNLDMFPGIDFLHHHYIVLSQWRKGRSPWECEVQDLPPAWLELIREVPKPKKIYQRAHAADGSVIKSDHDILKNELPTWYVQELAGLIPNKHGFIECPGHSDEWPSLKVYDTPDEGWFCYQCSRGGDIYEFGALVAGLPREWKSEPIMAAKLFDAVASIYERLWGVESEF